MQVYFKTLVYLHRPRKDNNYSVKIRISFKSNYAYIDAGVSVHKRALTKSGNIKNQAILDKCNDLIRKYREIINSIPNIDFYNVQDIKQFILDGMSASKPLDFIELFEQFISEREESPSINIYKTTYNHIVRFSGQTLLVDSITPEYLFRFESYLASKIKSRGVNLYLSTLRTVYNWMIDNYEYKGYSFRYPFRKYKVPRYRSQKTIALTKEQLLAIINTPLRGIRANRSRDLFVISLFTLGTNAKDLYLLDKISPRIEYKRSKTRKAREDEAFISIKVEPELKPYLDKYKGSVRALCLCEWYPSPSQLNASLREGLIQAVEQINALYGDGFLWNIDYYDARRSVASIMRNRLDISKDNVALCLNHVDKNTRITDVYIEIDFSLNDKHNRMFIDWLFS